MVAVSVSISVGEEREPAPAVGGFYVDLGLLGEDFKLEQSGQFVDMSGSASGKLRLRDDRLKGTVDCAGGGTAEIDLGFREGLQRHGRVGTGQRLVCRGSAGAGCLGQAREADR